MKCFVTGAAGFIGSTLVERLLAEGRSVVGLDNFDSFYAESEKLRNLETALASDRYRLVRSDIRDADRMKQVFASERFDGVVHLAALAGVRPSHERPADFADVNVLGTTRVLEAAVSQGKPQIVFASSSSVYGEREDGPFLETDSVDRPVSPYAATKPAGELVAHTFHHAFGLPITCARIFTCYGPRQRPDLAIRKFADLMRRGKPIPIYGDGTALRDFTFIDDLVDGLVRLMNTDDDLTGPVNLGNPNEFTIAELAELILEITGSKSKIVYEALPGDDPTQRCPDIGLAKKTLGWEPKVPLREGLTRTIEYFEQIVRDN